MISDPWIDRRDNTGRERRRKPPQTTFKTDAFDRFYANQRRAELRRLGKCKNGPLVGYVSQRGTVHGPVVKGGKCARCLAIYEGERAPQQQVSSAQHER